MYSDLYTKLSVDERKVLETYHKRLAASKLGSQKSSPQSLMPQSTKNRTESKQKTLTKQNSSKVFKNKGVVKRALSKTSNTLSSAKYKKESIGDGFNVKYEVEKLLRALYRHSVICPEFKQELKELGGVALLDEYLKYKEVKSLG
jgi:hypothetical protein